MQIITKDARYMYTHGISRDKLLAPRRVSITFRQSPLKARVWYMVQSSCAWEQACVTARSVNESSCEMCKYKVQILWYTRIHDQCRKGCSSQSLGLESCQCSASRMSAHAHKLRFEAPKTVTWTVNCDSFAWHSHLCYLKAADAEQALRQLLFSFFIQGLFTAAAAYRWVPDTLYAVVAVVWLHTPNMHVCWLAACTKLCKKCLHDVMLALAPRHLVIWLYLAVTHLQGEH